MRTMYDAIDASNLPAGGDLYAGYIDGDWPDADAISERFPHARVVRIATSPSTDDGEVGDGPPDNGTWPEWVQWVRNRRAAGQDPSLNTDLNSWDDGIAAFRAAGVLAPHWWISDYDGDATLAAGEVAKQYASNDAYDTSVVADYWPGVDPAPAPPPIPRPEEDTMLIIDAPRSADADAVRDMWLLGNGKYTHIPDDASYEGIKDAGVEVAVIGYPLHEAWLTAYGVAGVTT
jgi:hypothetical protein